jgi:cytoskeletal protein CcmA (bactofilin family)
LDVDGNATFHSNVQVDDNVTIDGTLDVDGASTLNSTLDVDGASTLNSSLDVDGVTTLNDSLDVDGNATFHSNVQVDDNVTIDGTLDVDGASTLNSTLDVDGVTTLNDSLDVDGNATFHSNVQVDDNVTIDGTLDVDGASTLNSTLDVDGVTTLNDSLDVDGNATFHSNVQVDDNLDVDGATDLDSTLDVQGATNLQSTLTVGGNATFNDYVDMNDTLDVAMAGLFRTPVATGTGVDADGELVVYNEWGAAIFEVDGHNDITVIQNLLVQNDFDYNGDLEVSGDLSAGFGNFSMYVESGANTLNALLPLQNNHLTRKDYVDGQISIVLDSVQVAMDSIAAHRTELDALAAAGDDLSDRVDSLALITDTLRLDVDSLFAFDAAAVDSLDVFRDSLDSYHARLQDLEGRPEAWSHDAGLSLIDTTGAANNKVYYLNGNLVLYADSTDAGKNYTITVIGENLDGAAKLYAENNHYDVTDWTVTGGTQATFNIGYADIDGLVRCDEGVVRVTLVIDGKMTGLHLFFDIVAPAIP